MTQSNQDAAGPARPRAVTPQIPRRPKDVPPAVTIDPVGQVVADLLPVTVTGSANPGITWSWNPREPGWDPGPMVTYTGVQVTTDAGLTVDATPVGPDWGRWAPTGRHGRRPEVWPFTTISCAAMGGDLHLVSVAEQLWHSVKPAGGGSSWEISAPVPAGNSAELGPFGTVGCAGVGENLHVAATLAPFQ